MTDGCSASSARFGVYTLVMADELSVNSLTSGKCLQNLESAYFTKFFSYLGTHTDA